MRIIKRIIVYLIILIIMGGVILLSGSDLFGKKEKPEKPHTTEVNVTEAPTVVDKAVVTETPSTESQDIVASGSDAENTPDGISKMMEMGTEETTEEIAVFDYKEVPAYSGMPYVTVNDNEPFFTEEEMKTENTFLEFSELDSLGRVGVASSCLNKTMMPTEPRGEIGDIKPSGWHTIKYEGYIADRYLYNRCHLIGYQLCGDNSDIRNFMTGTRSFNVDGMEPFENQVAEFIKNRNYNVLYRVTPVFEDNNLVASGVLLEAVSLESGIKPKKERELCISVFVYNVQENIEIDYATGDSKVINSHISKTNHDCDYIVNKKSKKFHKPDCDSVKDMEDRNKTYFTGDREKLIEEGYKPCKRCDP